MDDQNSKRWLETMRREKKAKEAWQHKYLTAEELASLKADQDALAKIEAEKPAKPKKLSERDVMEARLSKMESEDVDPIFGHGEDGSTGEKPMHGYQLQRERIRQQVAASRPMSHRMTRDLRTEALLADMGPGLWISVNPAYTHATKRFFTSAQAAVHVYEPNSGLGWGERVDKTHHLRSDDFMKHADKCLELGEKPFTSGGMKLSGGGK